MKEEVVFATRKGKWKVLIALDGTLTIPKYVLQQLPTNLKGFKVVLSKQTKEFVLVPCETYLPQSLKLHYCKDGAYRMSVARVLTLIGIPYRDRDRRARFDVSFVQSDGIYSIKYKQYETPVNMHE